MRSSRGLRIALLALPQVFVIANRIIFIWILITVGKLCASAQQKQQDNKENRSIMTIKHCFIYDRSALKIHDVNWNPSRRHHALRY